ncbi:NO-associated protein 1 chloroplastic/mitochondrial, partial [Zea mays]
VDLLPRDTNLNCIGDWVVESVVKKKLNVLSVHLTSSKSLVGITGVTSEIHQERNGRDVNILGSANVGKICIYQCNAKNNGVQGPGGNDSSKIQANTVCYS